ncbi:HD family hydrolase [Halalkaliarchaeum desulfuricum]|uniref:HD family hydrolase n=1 Tax=Halalkaliarchaeum desulfuricum TaxID=2055893 RepID=A0A343TJJ2_9EURY|nr:GTP pyrophosphokinase [Halalkaliarchaeum desulfuricum]AUX09264.1 HD family hydrolase [Halalkaliarchaeum desulfuricum]
MNGLERAIDLTVDAYAGQTDKADETHIRHSLRVMEEMDSEKERVVAVLHDVVEDTSYTLEDIEREREVGSRIRDSVDALAKRESESYPTGVRGARGVGIIFGQLSEAIVGSSSTDWNL